MPDVMRPRFSRAEEAENLADALRVLGNTNTNKKNYTVIAMDLPSSGYADNLDHCAIPRPRTGVGFCDSLFALGDLTSASRMRTYKKDCRCAESVKTLLNAMKLAH